MRGAGRVARMGERFIQGLGGETPEKDHLENLDIYIYIYIYIQGVTGGTDQTSGGCSLC